jgi:epoxyqueuosine reductase
VCPWNKYAQRSALPDFDVREPLGDARLLALWAWSEAEFLQRTAGSAIRRIGFERWQRNLAVALGNALRTSGEAAVAQALRARREDASPLVKMHIDWALAQTQTQAQTQARA